ncbi:hypothetical protein HDU98_009793 [Podochytrium sp. JEL0797]|nr:hypothetical protein HDU98_009793 [Podochytrium sp. JEL0797]
MALFHQAHRLHSSGQHRERIDTFQQAYTLVSSHSDFLAWGCLVALHSHLDDHRRLCNSNDAAFFKDIQNNPQVATFFRAKAAAIAGLVCFALGDREAMIILFRKIVSLCNKLTTTDLDKEICIGVHSDTKRPKMETVRMHLNHPSSFLTIANQMLQHQGIPSNVLTPADFQDQRLMTGLMSEERKAKALPLLQQHSPLSLTWAKSATSAESLAETKNPSKPLGVSNSGNVVSPNIIARLNARRKRLQKEKWMNSNVFEIRGPAAASSTGEARWIVLLLGGGKEVALKPSNLTRVMFKEERWNWERLEDNES